MSEVRGYKVFNPDWTCMGKQYTCPGMFEEDVKPELCVRGMHFCKHLKDCFNYYPFADATYHFAVVIAHGEICEDTIENKCCTNKLEIVHEMLWEEVSQIINIGHSCFGMSNTGWGNSGNYNTGCCNAGFSNSGDFNLGNGNTGNYNFNDYNSGRYNFGRYNTGNFNSGNHNSGEWNYTDFSAGCFNTEHQFITMFNKPTNWTPDDWIFSSARRYLYKIASGLTEWVFSPNMTDEEKDKHPEHKITCGFLRQYTSIQERWDAASDAVKATIMSLPNFDAEIFKQCTGIQV